jgi:hypothetical protein
VDVLEFSRSFDAKIKRLKLPSDAKLQEPDLESTLPPLTWQIEFFISFTDGSCIRIWELYEKVKGLYDSHRTQWSYHYGAAAREPSGRLRQAAADAPVVVRIDTCGGTEHLHYRAREPHYSPAQIVGLDLKSIDCWQFIKNVLKHRDTGKAVDQVFGVQVGTK